MLDLGSIMILLYRLLSFYSGLLLPGSPSLPADTRDKEERRKKRKKTRKKKKKAILFAKEEEKKRKKKKK